MNTKIKEQPGVLTVNMYGSTSLRELNLKPSKKVTCLQIIKEIKYCCSPHPFKWTLDGIEIFPNVSVIEIIGSDGVCNVVETLKSNNVTKVYHIIMCEYGMRDENENNHEDLVCWEEENASIFEIYDLSEKFSDDDYPWQRVY